MSLESPSPVFAQLLKRCRVEATLTQEALAERAGLSRRGIQNLERGRTKPYRDTLERLVGALDLSPADRAAFEAAATATPRRRILSPTRPPDGQRRRLLPAQLTALIGREGEVAEAVRLLSVTRLVTLTGPPGSGKTRLAVEVAERVGRTVLGGVHFVSLMAVRDPGLVASALAHALRVSEAGGRTLLESLRVALDDQERLLVLDNFEQVLAAAPLVTDLLQACRSLKVLVTSRVALRLNGEQEYRVPPLATPDPSRLPPLDDVIRFPAVRLFVERSQAVEAAFTLTSENAHAVASICYRLDGLPLAIELAASRSRILPPSEILARLDRRLALLTGGARDLPARHQTLRDALDWSYDLLEWREKALLQRLAIFSGGATLEAIAAVCDWSGDLGADVLDGVHNLVASSLLQRLAGSREPRFLLLESVREYAAERLQTSGERVGTQSRHVDFFLGLATAAGRERRGLQDAAWLESLEPEYDNLYAALRFLVERGDASRALQLGAQLASLWQLHGRFTEGRATLTELFALPWDADSAASRVKALFSAGCLALAQSDFAEARLLLEQSLALAQELCDPRGMAESLNLLGLLAGSRGEYTAARSMLEESLRLQRELGDQWEIASSLNRLGDVALLQGDYEAALPQIEEGLAIRQQLGDHWGLGYSLLNVGLVARMAGDAATALARCEHALAVHRGIGHHKGMAQTLRALGRLAIDAGDVATAGARLREGLEIARDLGMRGFVASILAEYARLADLQHQPDRALRLWGAAGALSEALGEPLAPEDQRILAHQSDLARQAQGEEAANAAWIAGRAMTMEQAVAEALAGGRGSEEDADG